VPESWAANNGLATALGPDSIGITWTLNSVPLDAIGFDITRSVTGITGSYEKVNATLLPMTTDTYLDTERVPFTIYFYIVYVVLDDFSSVQWTPVLVGITFPLPEPQITPLLSSLDFGEVSVGGTELGPQAVVIRNTGGKDDLELTTRTRISGPDAESFRIVNTPEPGASLLPDSTWSILIDFTPSTAGKKTAHLLVSTNDPDDPTTRIAFSGKGVVSIVRDKDKLIIVAGGGAMPALLNRRSLLRRESTSLRRRTVDTPTRAFSTFRHSMDPQKIPGSMSAPQWTRSRLLFVTGPVMQPD